MTQIFKLRTIPKNNNVYARKKIKTFIIMRPKTKIRVAPFPLLARSKIQFKHQDKFCGFE